MNGYCQYFCDNTNGSFVCSCPEGYQLTNDGRTCKGMLASPSKCFPSSHPA